MKNFFKIILTGIFIFGFNESNNVLAFVSLTKKTNIRIKTVLNKKFIFLQSK